MSNKLKVITDDVLPIDVRTELDSIIDIHINQHKHNRQAINALTFECFEALTEADNAQSKLENKGFLSRLWGELSGSNQRLQNKINKSKSAAQYASQQILQKLSDQNLMSFELITALNNKLNISISKSEDKFKNIFIGLNNFFEIYRSNLSEFEIRVKTLEQNVNILTWLGSIEYLNHNEVSYSELSEPEKVVCLVRDFYDLTNGDWNTKELLLLKSAMSQIGLDPANKMNYMQVIKEVAKKTELKNKLLDGKKIFKIQCPEQMLGLSIIKKIEDIKIPDYQIVPSPKEKNKFIRIPLDRDAYLESYTYLDDLILNYMKYDLKVDPHTYINAFDLIVDLLFNLKAGNDFNIYQDDINKSESDKTEMVKRVVSTIVDIFCGLKYEYGLGVEQNYQKAFEFYSKQVNDPNTMFKVGEMYYEGEGVESNKEKAFRWFKAAADNGHDQSQHKLGLMYYIGEGVNLNYNMAFEYFLKAANKGVVESQYEVGFMYDKGVGVEQNSKKAFDYYIKSAERGYANSQYEVAMMYFYGKGVERNWLKARDWFANAARNGNNHAQEVCRILQLPW